MIKLENIAEICYFVIWFHVIKNTRIKKYIKLIICVFSTCFKYPAMNLTEKFTCI